MFSKLKSWLAETLGNVVWRVTPVCHEMTQLISQEQEGKLPWLLRLRMRLHLTFCTWCLRYRKQLQLIRKAMRLLPEQDGDAVSGRLSENAKERLKRTLRAGDETGQSQDDSGT